MSSQPSSQRAITRASKNIGISEDLIVDDGNGGGAASRPARNDHVYYDDGYYGEQRYDTHVDNRSDYG